MDEDFFRRDTADVAENLLGCELVHEMGEKNIRGKIVETEAYYGDHVEDPASHAEKGRTERNAPMFGSPGRSYIYVCYGIHHMFNITTEEENQAGAVLIRAVEPMEGLDKMRENREVEGKKNLCNGPGKLCQALDIDKSHNREDLTQGHLRVEYGDTPQETSKSSRIGITGGEDLEWRFYVKDNRFVSRS